MWETVIQLGIGAPGLAAVYLTQHARADFRKYACVFGLASQPLWFMTTIPNEQWGIVALNVAYTYIWSRSAYRLWVRPVVWPWP